MSYITGMVTTRVDASTDQQWALGTIGQDSSGYLYKYVKYDTGGDGVTAVAANAVYYHGVDGYKDNEVTMDLSDSVKLGAGILLSVPGNGEFCWIQLTGPATMAQAPTAGADGNALTAVGADADGKLDVSGAVTDCVVAYAGDISDNEIICAFPL